MMSVFKGPALAALAMLSFSGMGVCVKIAEKTIPVTETVLFRAALSGIIVALLARREKVSLVGNRTGLLCIRGMAGAAALFLLFFALKELSVGSALLLNQTTPIFVLPLAAIFLKERITARHVILAATAVVGVAFVVKPSATMPLIPALMALASALFAAVAYAMIRFLSATEHPLIIVFWFNLMSTIAAIPAAAPFFIVPPLESVLVLLALVVFATLGQVLMTYAYRYGEAGKIAVVGSTGALFGAGFDYVIWDHLPDMLTAVGGVIVIISCTLIQMIGAHGQRQK